jgi:O-acetyl-ADP-ribose deacetylase (regulator of RNase III)
MSLISLSEVGGSTRLAFGDRRLIVDNSDLATLTADAFVCPVDPTLDVRHGLAKILNDAAGGLPRERPAINEPFGKVIVLPGGNLRAKYVFLSVLLGERGLDKIKISIRQAVDRSIQYAEFLRLKSIAFPLLGSALALPPYEFVARQMLEEVAQYLRRRRTRLKLVVFSIRNPEAFGAFRKEARDLANL